MKEKGQYYVLKEKAVPEVLLKVVEAKRLIESGKIASVQEATEKVGISRSSFYKYKDDIFPFHDTAKGRTITIHKSQGSEYPAVVIPLLGGPMMLMNRNLLYTAVTRARKCVTLVGNEVTFQQMIRNTSQQKRYSGLCDRLKEN